MPKNSIFNFYYKKFNKTLEIIRNICYTNYSNYGKVLVFFTRVRIVTIYLL